MQGRIIKLAGVGVVLFIALGIAYVAGFRAKSPLVLNTIRRGLRATRPIALKSSGTPGARASIVRHVGRTTGRPYETPVQAVATEGGFVIALPYGPNTDWLQNVVAAGSATIVHDGDTFRVDQPEIVAMSAAAPHFSPKDQRAHRLFGVDRCLVVRRVAPDRPLEHIAATA